MPRKYKPVPLTLLTREQYTLTPVRDEDKVSIRQWRNEQIDILRQDKPLTEEEQNIYFKKVIDELFAQEKPKQLIFSFFESGKLIGYGGLVHIDWKKKSAEISFLTATERAIIKEIFIQDWYNYLEMIKQVANEYLNFETIYTYAYDIRPNLYIALEKSGFIETERNIRKIEINGQWTDTVIHTFYFSPIQMRNATEQDVDIYFKWANDPLVRELSFNQEKIEYASHVKWFLSKLKNETSSFYFFENIKKEAIGQVRIESSETEVIIGISIDADHRGLAYGSKMLRMACQDYFKQSACDSIVAYIKSENLASQAVFKRAGFRYETSLQMQGSASLRLILENEKH